jgi:hypothetical protein
MGLSKEDSGSQFLSRNAFPGQVFPRESAGISAFAAKIGQIARVFAGSTPRRDEWRESKENGFGFQPPAVAAARTRNEEYQRLYEAI